MAKEEKREETRDERMKRRLADEDVSKVKALDPKTHGDPVRQTPGWQAKRRRYLIDKYGPAGPYMFDKELADKFKLETCAAH